MSNQTESEFRNSSKLIRLGSLGVYAEDPSQVWGGILTFITLLIWLVYLNSSLGDLIFKSILTVIFFLIGTFAIYKFWIMFYRRIWKKIWPRK